MRWTLFIAGLSLCTAQEWRYWGGDAGGQKFSRLKQVDRANVSKLQVAWTYKTGEIADGKNYATRSAFETTPLMADGILYLTTPFNRVVALEPDGDVEVRQVVPIAVSRDLHQPNARLAVR